MKHVLRPRSILLLALLPAGCGSDVARPDPPENDGIYSHANGCFAVEGFDGVAAPTHLAATAGKDGFAFSEPDGDAASRFFLRASDLGTYLFYDRDRRYLTATRRARGQWQPAGVRSSTPLSSPAIVRDPRRYQVKHHASGLYLTFSGLTVNPSEAAIITLFPKEGCAEFPELPVDAKGAPAPRTWPDGDLYGIAEIHLT